MTTACAEASRTTIREGDWIVTREQAAADSHAALAEANSSLEGNWKYVLEGRQDRLSLRLDERPEDEAEQSRDAHLTLEDLKRRIETIGFRCNARADRIIVDLLEGWPAELVRDASGVWSGTVSIPIAAAENGSRDAIALLMLRASGAMRIARGFVAGNTAGFSVRFAAACSEEAMAVSLHALSASCRQFARSVSVLQNREAAAAYLALNANTRSTSQKGDEEDAWFNRK